MEKVPEAEGTVKKKKRRLYDAVKSDDVVGLALVSEPETQLRSKRLKNPSEADHVALDHQHNHVQDAAAENLKDSLKWGGSTGKQPAESKSQPVLPWMRLPIRIAAGQGVPLEDVRGLDQRLQDALTACKPSTLLLY